MVAKNHVDRAVCNAVSQILSSVSISPLFVSVQDLCEAATCTEKLPNPDCSYAAFVELAVPNARLFHENKTSLIQEKVCLDVDQHYFPKNHFVTCISTSRTYQLCYFWKYVLL